MGGQNPPHRILDAGSGFGQYSYYIARRFPATSILAVDVKDDQIRDCEAFFRHLGVRNIECALQDLLTLRRTDEFDCVISVDVMEHIVDDRAVFRNFSECLKQGGVLLVNTPANLSGAMAQESFTGEHVRYGYTPEELRVRLEEAGLEVERTRFAYGRWGYYAWVLGIKIPLLILNKSRTLFFLLPFYYILTFPFSLMLMVFDYYANNRSGGGLLVVARKT
jgi:SAM-dependent methyltransferase